MPGSVEQSFLRASRLFLADRRYLGDLVQSLDHLREYGSNESIRSTAQSVYEPAEEVYAVCMYQGETLPDDAFKMIADKVAVLTSLLSPCP